MLGQKCFDCSVLSGAAPSCRFFWHPLRAFSHFLRGWFQLFFRSKELIANLIVLFVTSLDKSFLLPGASPSFSFFWPLLQASSHFLRVVLAFLLRVPISSYQLLNYLHFFLYLIFITTMKLEIDYIEMSLRHCCVHERIKKSLPPWEFQILQNNRCI